MKRILTLLAALAFASPAWAQQLFGSSAPPPVGTPGNVPTFGSGGALGDSGNAIGPYASNEGRIGCFAYGPGTNGTAGSSQGGICVLRAVSTSTAAVRLTADGNAAGATNCINLPNNSVVGLTFQFAGVDTTAANNAYAAGGGRAAILRGSGAGNTTVSLGYSGSGLSSGTGSSVVLSVSADTTNGCLNVFTTPPNADTWDWSFSATYGESH